ncbi:TonB-dependent receptor [Methylophaga frappieri]|uniref:TonB-dependent receptor n=1 Tax=Methylophaga frappieri (strain ATCC BAA-2434 / DSM 25690 / JAM7) TaxID=754477 RepID=I1YF78_METFJ|nr:TonB-dependent receptor [Methylophaga frappieri]AFJ01571.1 TonB-dependent receptor [Methylophaga frappieri]
MKSPTKRGFSPKPRLLSSLMLLSLTTGSAFANTEADDENTSALETFVVTAEKREDKVLEIPSSISVMTSDTIEDAGIESLTEISQYVPNLHNFTWGGRRDSNIFIRGIGPGLFTDPTVGFYVDGVNYTSNGMFDMDLLNIERIEVLRGPQGTLYGGNSLAGVINIVTKQPTNRTEGRASISTDSLHQHRFLGNFSTPLVEDSLFFGGAISALKSDGYIDNTFNGDDYGAREDYSGRGTLRWFATDRLEATLAMNFEKFRGDSYAFGPAAAIEDDPDEISNDFDGVDERDSFGTALTLDWAGDNVDITSITSWQQWDGLNSADQDAGSMPGFSFTSTTEEEHQQISQELRFASNHDHWIDWLFGLYAYKSEFDVDSVNVSDFTAFGQGGPYIDATASKRENTGYAAFGQLDFALTDRLTLTTGLRVDHEEREATVKINGESSGTFATFSGDDDFNELLPKVALSYLTENNSLIYGSISKGYRAGGFDTLYPNLENPTYDSESSINYEVGFKSRFLDDRLELSSALFLIDIDDQQVQQLLSSGTIITDNAASSRSQGVELELRFKPADGWLISLAGNYTDATFDDYQGINLATFAPEDYSDNKLPNAPKFTANLSIQNRRPLGNGLTLFTRIDNQYIDSYYFDAPNALKQDAYNLVNARIGVESHNWSAYLWVKNALDEYYSKAEFEFGFGPTAEAGDPRSFGITVATTF